MKKLKIQDLKEGKIYKIICKEVEGICKYRIKDGLLQVKSNEEEWKYSPLLYNDIAKSYFVEVKREIREIDWTKVPRGTKVQVREGVWNKIWHNRYFIKYENSYEKCFCTGIYLDDIFMDRKIEDSLQTYKYCKIHPSVEIPDEWYKEE